MGQLQATYRPCTCILTAVIEPHVDCRKYKWLSRYRSQRLAPDFDCSSAVKYRIPISILDLQVPVLTAGLRTWLRSKLQATPRCSVAPAWWEFRAGSKVLLEGKFGVDISTPLNPQAVIESKIKAIGPHLQAHLSKRNKGKGQNQGPKFRT